MLRSVKTVSDTMTYSLNDLAVSPESLLISSGGILGLEWSYSRDKEHLHLFADPVHSPSLPTVSTGRCIAVDNSDISCFSLISKRASFLPFHMNYRESIWTEVKRCLEPKINKEQILFQLVLKKRFSQEWQFKMQRQYQDYLDGIDFPATNKLFQTIQYKMLEFIKRTDEWVGRNIEVVGAENKYYEEGFTAQLRFLLQGGSIESRSLLAKRIYSAFTVLNHANKWTILLEKNQTKFIENIQLRRLPLGSNQILCVSELLPFFNVETLRSLASQGYNNQFPDVVPVPPRDDDSIYSLLPIGESKSHEFDTSFPERLNAALKKLRLINDSHVVIQSIQHGSTLKKITFSLPSGLTLTNLTHSKKNIQTELALSNISFEQGKEASTAAMMIPNEERSIVYLGDIVRSEAFMIFSKTATLPVILGLDTVGNPIFADLVKLVHLLVCGATGSGKSVFINTLLLILLIHKSPRELQLLCIDPKRVELACYKAYPHVLDVITDTQKAYQALAALVKKMEERYSLFEKKGYRNIAQYNKNEKDSMPYIVCIIDELADLIMSVGVVEDEIVKLAQKSRACGIHLIIGTQRPQKEIVTGLIKSNVYSRACFACDSGVSYRVALDETPKTTLLGKGDGLLRLEGIQGLQRFQAPLIALSDDEMTSIIEQYSSHWKGAFKRDTLATDQIEVIESDLDKVKRIIATTGETRTKPLQELLGVRNEKVSELLKQLEMEGWVRYSGTRSKGYEIIVSEEDRRKYKKP